jgi:hypothetical protein
MHGKVFIMCIKTTLRQVRYICAPGHRTCMFYIPTKDGPRGLRWLILGLHLLFLAGNIFFHLTSRQYHISNCCYIRRLIKRSTDAIVDRYTKIYTVHMGVGNEMQCMLLHHFLCSHQSTRSNHSRHLLTKC